MKKAFRIAVRVLAFLAAMVVLLAVVCLDFVDTRPYFRESYYTETAARLKTVNANSTVWRGALAAGFGRAKLTPTVGSPDDIPEEGKFRSLPLAGYGNRDGKPATGVHDDLYVKAVALKVDGHLAVMVGADALIIPPEVTAMATRRLEKDNQLSRDQIYLSATHTHCSIGGWGAGVVAEAFAGGFQPGSRVWFANCIVAAVREALADIKPAEYGAGRFAIPQFIRNRVVGDLGRVDPEFSYIVLKQTAGRTAVMGAYGAHATTLSGGQMDFSADYPGAWQRAIEKQTGGLAVFLAGDVGSQSPVPGDKDFAGTERMGQALAAAVLEKVAATSVTNTISLGIAGLDVTLPPFNARLTDSIRLRPWLAAELLPASGHSYLQAFRLDHSIWVSTPCDFSGELALGIKDSFRARGKDITITSFNGDYIGYVILPRYYHLDGYEPRTMSFFGPYVPDYFEELIRSMSLSLAERRLDVPL